MTIVLFEDSKAGDTRPATLARAAFDLSCAGTSLYRIVRALDLPIASITRPYIKELCSRDRDFVKLPSSDCLFINASLVPSIPMIASIAEKGKAGISFVETNKGRIAAAYLREFSGLSDCACATVDRFILERGPKAKEGTHPIIELPTDLIRYHLDFLEGNLPYIQKGLKESSKGVFLGEGASVHPSCALDSSKGQIILGPGVRVMPFSYIEGPVVIGQNTKILDHASIKEGTQIGERCKIGGEVETSIIESFSNKQHYGFIGHAWIGSWVNLGAGTTNSDLKNTYGEISIDHMGKKTKTGLSFAGCMIGDYSKSAINTSLFTAKKVGVSSHLYGFVTGDVPSFTNYARSFGQITEFHLDAAIRTQERMFERRGIKQDKIDIKLLKDLFAMTQEERPFPSEPLQF